MKLLFIAALVAICAAGDPAVLKTEESREMTIQGEDAAPDDASAPPGETSRASFNVRPFARLGACPTAPRGWTAYSFTDVNHNDIGSFGTDMNRLLAVCGEKLSCRSFNSWGWVKHSSDPRQYHSESCLMVANDRWNSGQTLWPGHSMTSKNGRYFAIFQTDGNFVLYESGIPRWASGTNGKGRKLEMTRDGYLVIWDRFHWPVWWRGPAGPGARLILQNDRNLVLYNSNWKAIWASNTWIRGVPLTVRESGDLLQLNEITDTNDTSAVPPPLMDAEESEETGSPVWLWPVLGSVIGIILIAAGVGGVVYWKRKQRRQSSDLMTMDIAEKDIIDPATVVARQTEEDVMIAAPTPC